MIEDRTPASLLRELSEEMRELSDAAEAFGRARRSLARCETIYERRMTEKLIELQAEYRESGERLPGEEMRKAICHSRLTDDERSNLLIAEAEVAALDKFIRVKTTVISGIQSELSFMRTEFATA